MRLIALLLLLPLGFCGCSKVLPTPGKVVEDFLRYADQGDYSTAGALMTDATASRMKAVGGFEIGIGSLVPKGKLDTVKILKEEVSGSTAKVEVQYSFKPSGGGGGTFKLVRSGLSWKIDNP